MLHPSTLAPSTAREPGGWGVYGVHTWGHLWGRTVPVNASLWEGQELPCGGSQEGKERTLLSPQVPQTGGSSACPEFLSDPSDPS